MPQRDKNDYGYVILRLADMFVSCGVEWKRPRPCVSLCGNQIHELSMIYHTVPAPCRVSHAYPLSYSLCPGDFLTGLFTQEGMNR